MIFDIFFSISQTEVDGIRPTESHLFSNFFDQVQAADDLGFNTAWLAESHLSSEVQKLNPNPVIPHFKGEVGINVDFFQISTRIFAKTKRLNTGSAIMNILCNGGPIAAAERVKSFLAFHQLDPTEDRKIEVGFASGRFPYINHPYGIVPRNDLEKSIWGPVMVNLILKEAAEIFIRLIKGEILDTSDISQPVLRSDDFRNPDDWQRLLTVFGKKSEQVEMDHHYHFNKLKIIPSDINIKRHLNLLIGSHDPRMQRFVNSLHPVGVFNLSITSNATVEKTNEMMSEAYHSDGGKWTRDKMPRTVLVFINNNPKLTKSERIKAAQDNAKQTLSEYWKALEGTLDPVKVQQAENNALIGDPEAIIAQMRERFNQADRLMLWFDFHNHNSTEVINSMRSFMETVAPEFK
ncbi:MAG: LLM class flavin-dependent oxidoreductase [Calditrichaeota bacterium]|nr:LLM class flavin-dependent oxidoreductase [Calditrichota bacterium]